MSSLDCRGKEIDLITSATVKRDDQLKKPYALRSFGTLARQVTGKWPAIHLNNNLHSKVYLIQKQGSRSRVR